MTGGRLAALMAVILVWSLFVLICFWTGRSYLEQNRACPAVGGVSTIAGCIRKDAIIDLSSTPAEEVKKKKPE